MLINNVAFLLTMKSKKNIRGWRITKTNDQDVHNNSTTGNTNMGTIELVLVYWYIHKHPFLFGIEFTYKNSHMHSMRYWGADNYTSLTNHTRELYAPLTGKSGDGFV